MRKEIRFVFLDWGDTLMVDYPMYRGPMVYWPRTTLMDGVADLLPKLALKYKCVVLTGAGDSSAEQIRRVFTKHGVDKCIFLYLTSKELNAQKPSPDFFINALKLSGASAAETLMVGNDYVKDITPAKEAGLSTAFITEGNGVYLNADYVVGNFSELSFLL
jgi:putative hydrolase of the HAD superfamily